jgi:hypothetical protein
MRYFAIISLVLMAGAFTSLTASGQTDQFDELGGGLQERLDALAQNWSRDGLLRNHRKISVGTFEYKGDPNGINSGINIKDKLKTSLQNQRFLVDDDNWTCKIQGKYDLVKSNDKGSHSLVDIVFDFVDPSGKVLQQDERPKMTGVKIKEPKDVADITGYSVALQGDIDQQKQQLDEQISKKSLFLDKENGKEVLRKDEKSPYGFEILVLDPKDNVFKKRSMNVRNGNSTINFTRGEIFQIQLFNDSDKPAAVEVKLDGLNVFNIAEDKKFHNARFIVQPKSSHLVKSWFRRGGADGGNEFKVGRITDAVARKFLTNDKVNIGMITVIFSQAWEKGNPPAEIPPGRGDSKDELAITIGDGVNVKVDLVEYEWSNFNTTLLHVRYDQPD